MKVIHINYYDTKGGAVIAAFRIHNAIQKQGIDSFMWVFNSKSNDSKVINCRSRLTKNFPHMKRILGRLFSKVLKTQNRAMYHSPAIFSSKLYKKINHSDADIIHLHWVAGEMLSIIDIARIEKPIVWTFHDMWPFCGSEHYTEDYRWLEGYRKNNRPSYESGFDLNYYCWHLKQKYWKKPMNVVTPSNWLGECVSKSFLMREWPLKIIPNCIDTEIFKPRDKFESRKLFKLPLEKPLLLFGAVGGRSDSRKGFKHLKESLSILKKKTSDIELVIFGEEKPKFPIDYGYKTHYVGKIDDEKKLSTLFSGCDAIAIPSTQDNLPNVAVEALACGLPIISFRVGGMNDIVTHLQTGYIAENFDHADFANGLDLILNKRDINISLLCRQSALDKYSDSIVAKSYIDLYKKLV